MGRGSDYWLDAMLLVLMMALSLINLPALAKEWSVPLSSGIKDKSTVVSTAGVYHEDTVKTGQDLLMSLIVLDDYVQYPRSIRINDTPIIDLDTAWMTNHSANVSAIYNINGQWKLGSMLNYTITKVEYVENNGDPYWHYVLEDV